MLKLSQDEIDIIKKTEALPKSVIARRLAELLDEMLIPESKSEEDVKDFRIQRLFAIELRKWLKTIKLFTKKEQEIKKEDFI